MCKPLLTFKKNSTNVRFLYILGDVFATCKGGLCECLYVFPRQTVFVSIRLACSTHASMLLFEEKHNVSKCKFASSACPDIIYIS